MSHRVSLQVSQLLGNLCCFEPALGEAAGKLGGVVLALDSVQLGIKFPDLVVERAEVDDLGEDSPVFEALRGFAQGVVEV